MRKLLIVVGTRPNFIKVSRFPAVAAQHGTFTTELVHTAQHSDADMSAVFFEQFGLWPDRVLDIPPGSAAARIGHIMLALEPVMLNSDPTAVVVVGDVDSTLAAALCAQKSGIPVVHVEAGLRSGDPGMPEEVNRILTDRISQRYFITEASGRDNLLREGADPFRIHHVGNTMIDTLIAQQESIKADPILEVLGLQEGGHVLMTMHRPATVDFPGQLKRMLDLVQLLSLRHRVVFPIHPRTQARLEQHALLDRLRTIPGIIMCGPLGYHAFQKLLATSAFVVTDSGGVQEETTYCGIPCLTLRPNTERPVTITEGTNELMPFDLDILAKAVASIEAGTTKKGRIPELWDGRATERIMEILHQVL